MNNKLYELNIFLNDWEKATSYEEKQNILFKAEEILTDEQYNFFNANIDIQCGECYGSGIVEGEECFCSIEKDIAMLEDVSYDNYKDSLQTC